MKKATLEALIKSRNKWKRIYGSTKAGDNGTKNCALCKLFLTKSCKDCPVDLKTNGHGCAGIYTKWADHQGKKHHVRFPKYRIPYCKKCKQLAYDEMKFLDDLLPKEHRIC